MGRVSPTPPSIRFFADAMLGRLAKRLRLAGFDTVYENWIADADLVRKAVDEDRVILTRDRRLVLRRAAKNSLLLQSEVVNQQWQEMVVAFPVILNGPALSRCAECNALLHEFPKEALESNVPPYVYATQARFWRCTGCERIYWPGTHLEKILRNMGRGA